MDRKANHRVGPSQLIIADDHPLFRSAIRDLLNRYSDLEVVGEAADGREALELCRRLHPQQALMDVCMPEMDGLAATRAIKQEFPDTAVLILTSFEDTSYLFEAIKVGAAGYILKSENPQGIVDAARGVLSGESPLSQELSAQLLRCLISDRREQSLEGPVTPSTSEEPSGSPLAESLAPRESEVLRLVARGHTNQESARTLLISTSTVKKHIHRIIDKLGVSDRVQ